MNVAKYKRLIDYKRRHEDEVYDEHTTGYGVLCVAKSTQDKGEVTVYNHAEFEICIPDYYFKKLMKEGKVTCSEEIAYIIADFYYDSNIGAVFDDEILRKVKELEESRK